MIKLNGPDCLPPLITVITATFNAVDYLPKVIESLRSQTDRNFDWIVVDGGSKDGTLALLGSAQDVITILKSEVDFGIYHALNKALALSSSEYYLVLGADDYLRPTAIEDFSRAALESHADIISGAVIVGDKVVSPPREPVWWRSTPLLVSAHSVGSLIRKNLHTELGYYSRRFPIAADTYFLLHVWRAGKSVHHISHVVGIFGSDGVSGTDILGGLCENFRANAEVRGNLIVNLFLLTLRILKNSNRIRRDLLRRRS